MRTNIDIDDELMAAAQRASGLSTKKAAVEAGLQLLIRLRAQEDILQLAGKVTWQGDLEESRGGAERRLIVVDTTVWVDHLNDTVTPQVTRLRDIISNRRALLVVGDLVLCEVLQGLVDDREARLVEQALRRFDVVPMVGPALASRAAANYRVLRTRGITVRKTIDMLIGTFCIEGSHTLLHNDRDFDGMERHLGLQVLH